VSGSRKFSVPDGTGILATAIGLRTVREITHVLKVVIKVITIRNYLAEVRPNVPVVDHFGIKVDTL